MNKNLKTTGINITFKNDIIILPYTHNVYVQQSRDRRTRYWYAPKDSAPVKNSDSRATVESRICRNKDNKLQGNWQKRDRDVMRVLVCVGGY